jgi:hypothetical protein
MLALGQNFMFKTLEPALCDAIVNAMEAYNVSAGTEVIKQVRRVFGWGSSPPVRPCMCGLLAQ